MNEWIGTRLNSQFQPITKGFVECPKCFGACELDLTPRDANGWPLGPPKRATCDHCDGEGEVKPAEGWPEPSKVEVEWTEQDWEDGERIERQEQINNSGWAMFND